MTILVAIIFILLNVVDWYLTQRILKKGGRELNPVIRWIGVTRSKLIFVPIVVILGFLIDWVVLIIPVLLLAAVCIWNYIQLRKIKKVGS